jgi:hypothetical protein
MAELSDYELLKQAGFSDDEILAEAGFEQGASAEQPGMVEQAKDMFLQHGGKLPVVGPAISALQAPGGLVQSVAQGATFGFADEAAAGVRSGLGKMGMNYGSYEDELAALRGELKDYRSSNPVKSFAGEVAGGAMPAVAAGLGGAALRGANTLRGVAGLGAASGGAYGFGSSEGGLGERAEGAATGAAFGAVAPAITHGIKEYVAKPIGRRAVSGARRLLDPVADAQSLQQPGTKAALRIADRQGYLNRPADSVRKVTPTVQNAVETVGNQADDLNAAIAAQLGADAGDTAVEKALSKDFQRAADRIVSSGILEQADTVEDLSRLTADRLRTLGSARERAARELDQVFLAVNSADTPRNRMIGAVSQRDLAEPIRELNKRIGELENTKLAAPISDGIKKTMRSILSDLSPPSDGKTEALMSPSRILNMTKNLNEIRRSLMKEFDSSNVARVVDKNSPSYASYQGSIEAISKLQSGLSRALEKQVDELSQAGGVSVPREIFTEINSEYGALKALQSMSDKFMRGTAKGRATRDPTRIVQNAGGESVLPNAFTPRGALQSGAAFVGNRLLDRPNAALQRASAVESRSRNAMANIQDYIQMSQNPPQFAPYGGGRLSAIESALSSGSQRAIPLLPVESQAIAAQRLREQR